MPFLLEDVAFHHRDVWGNATGGQVCGISLEVKPGSITCLTGPNGSGKSTIMKLCLGFALPVSGRIVRPRPFRPSYIGDGGRNLYPHLTALENLEYLLALRGWRKPQALHAKAGLLAGMFSLDAKGLPVGRMSRGMRQKASIICALLLPHDFLFADEPTLGLDGISVAAFEETIREERGEGKGVLLATNDLLLAGSVADVSVRVHGGSISMKEVPADEACLA